MHGTETQSQPIGTAAAAALLGLTRRQVVRLVERGRLTPITKMDGTTGAYLFAPETVAALATERAR